MGPDGQYVHTVPADGTHGTGRRLASSGSVLCPVNESTNAPRWPGVAGV